ncbi:hypothetical protein Tco_0851827 [Tanacetum coccineum]
MQYNLNLQPTTLFDATDLFVAAVHGVWRWWSLEDFDNEKVVLEFRACIVVGLSVFGSAHWKDNGKRESVTLATSTGRAVNRREEDTHADAISFGSTVGKSDDPRNVPNRVLSSFVGVGRHWEWFDYILDYVHLGGASLQSLQPCRSIPAMAVKPGCESYTIVCDYVGWCRCGRPGLEQCRVVFWYGCRRVRLRLQPRRLFDVPTLLGDDDFWFTVRDSSAPISWLGSRSDSLNAAMAGDDYFLFTVRGSSTPVSWLGSHSKSLIAAMAGDWYRYTIR